MADLAELQRRLRPAAYLTATSARPLPPADKAVAYVLAGNGVFKVARRRWMTAWIPLARCRVAGLPAVEPGLACRFRVPGEILGHILEDARLATSRATNAGIATPGEAMYFVHLDEQDRVRLEKPEQVGTGARVRYKANGAGSVVMEIHSHHEMAAQFSSTDDADETGFRLYGVVGRIFTRPEVALRVGVYGDFLRVGVGEVFGD